MRAGLLVCLAATLLLTGRPAAAQTPDVDQAFERFWQAPTPEDAAQAAKDVVASGVGFREAVRRLKQGRRYAPQPAGPVELAFDTTGGTRLSATVFVPQAYDPARRYPARLLLHGGIHDQHVDEAARLAELRRIGGEEAIVIVPKATEADPWWSTNQLDHLRVTLDRVKRRFNVDENRVTVIGVSDGGSGAYFVALRAPTPFSAFAPLNGFLMVLPHEGFILNEQLFPNNLRNRPFFTVNGGKDPLYPTDIVAPYVEEMRRGGVAIDFLPQPEAGHDTSWWPSVKETFEAFLAEHPRDPIPARLTWQVAEGDPFNRVHWMVLDDLVPAPDDPAAAPVADNDRFSRQARRGPPTPLFAYQAPSGRVDASLVGNTITATTEGVEELTLLVSPDRIDFARPVKILVNDKVVFEDRMIPNVAMLMKWAAIDNDRTMLFGAEMHVQIAE